MKRILITIFVPAVIACVLAAAAYAADKLNNDSIIELHKLGLGDAVIVEKIKTSTCTFDSNTDSLKKLKEAGISDAVIAAMISAGATKPAAEAGPGHEAGIFVAECSGAEEKMIKIEPQQILGTKSGFAFFAGYGQTTKIRAVLEGTHAAVQVKERRPTFYFYF